MGIVAIVFFSYASGQTYRETDIQTDTPSDRWFLGMRVTRQSEVTDPRSLCRTRDVIIHVFNIMHV